MNAQDRTLEQYQQFMRINAAAHLFRSARELGLLRELREGQRTHEQLCENLSLRPEATQLVLDALVATSIIEKYGDDYALSRVAHLLCQYDDDLGDATWNRLVGHVRGTGEPEADDQAFMNALAATQWVHTPAAMQAAEMLDLGGDEEVSGPTILDLGCGSAVWSSAMAHRDPKSKITGVDRAAALKAAQSTADSIGLGDRFQTIEAEPAEVDLGESKFDIVLVAQRLGCVGPEEGRKLLTKAVDALTIGGKLVVIDLFRGPAKPDMYECVEALKLELETVQGGMWTLEAIQAELTELGLERVEVTFMADSRVNMGMAIGKRPSDQP
ncbi:MAG: class I SAM-dependent methyltransferase [Rubripirellula sp.]|jgi:SAM-dependent methyltransferase|nr:class I SAM-dependent methyltransferase [Rubripirellula sp.]